MTRERKREKRRSLWIDKAVPFQRLREMWHFLVWFQRSCRPQFPKINLSLVTCLMVYREVFISSQSSHDHVMFYGALSLSSATMRAWQLLALSVVVSQISSQLRGLHTNDRMVVGWTASFSLPVVWNFHLNSEEGENKPARKIIQNTPRNTVKPAHISPGNLWPFKTNQLDFFSLVAQSSCTIKTMWCLKFKFPNDTFDELGCNMLYEGCSAIFIISLSKFFLFVVNSVPQHKCLQLDVRLKII